MIRQHPSVTRYLNLPVVPLEKTWQDATDKARRTAQLRMVIAKRLAVADSVDKGYAKLITDLDVGLVKSSVSDAVIALGKTPKRATAYNWVKAYKDNGLTGLLPNYKGSVKATHPWAHKCLEFYHSPNKPSFALVAHMLGQEGFKGVSQGKVRRFINGLPQELGPNSPYRMGSKLHREKHKDHLIRDTTHIAPGILYNADGHTIDVYLAHPQTGNPCRMELTAFQDVGSRKIVGWELSHAESAISTLTALTRCIRVHGHVPAILYVDNGSGYKASLMNDETSGIYDLFGIDVIYAIPGNAQAKWIERFFKHMEEWVGKLFPSFCGRGHTEREKHKILKEVKQGKRVLPSVDDWIAAFTNFLEHYHNSPHPEIEDKTRQQVWDEGLVRIDTGITDYGYLPRAKVNVRRGRVVLHKRTYAADMLHQYNGQELLAAYDMHDDKHIKLQTLDGVFIMLATLKSKTHAIPTDRIEEAKVKRLHGRLKRIDNERREIEAQEAIEHVIDVETTEQFNPVLPDVANQQLTEKTPVTFDIQASDFFSSPINKEEESIDLDSLLSTPVMYTQNKEEEYDL